MASSIVGQKTSVMFVKGLISFENGTVRVLARVDWLLQLFLPFLANSSCMSWEVVLVCY